MTHRLENLASLALIEREMALELKLRN